MAKGNILLKHETCVFKNEKIEMQMATSVIAEQKKKMANN